jgi:hypothetical protein
MNVVWLSNLYATGYYLLIILAIASQFVMASATPAGILYIKNIYKDLI